MARGNYYENFDSETGTKSRIVRTLVANKVWILGGLTLVFLISTIALAARGTKQVVVDNTVSTTTEPTTTYAPLCTNPPLEKRFNCHPEPGANEASCEARGCCFNLVENAPSEVPQCYFPDNYNGYSAEIISQTEYQVIVTLRRQRESGFPADVGEVNLEISFVNENMLRARFTDPSVRRWEVIPPLPLSMKFARDSSKFLYTVTVEDNILKVIRRSSNKVLVSTDLRRLVYSDQFLQIDWAVPSDYIYGLSEHKNKFRQNVTWNRYTIFNRGEQPKDAAKSPNLNFYGTHPMYMMVEDTVGTTHGVFVFNSNAMDVILQPGALTWRIVGGILDIFVYLGPTPRDVVKQHSQLIGTPSLPQFWTLGFHLSRYGYNSTNATVAAYERTINASIPLDCQWNDIDAFDAHNDFTYDHEKFEGLPDHIERLHNDSRKWVIILDPGVSNKEGHAYLPYDEGKAMDIFVKDNQGKDIEGIVWNQNTTVFVDFTNPRGMTYWARQIERFHSEVPFDALWVDMNEPYNFRNGTADNVCPDDNLERPPYVPGGDPLSTHTLCMTAQHHLGSHYNVHSLYAHYETVATNYALAGMLKTRPFVLSRANFAGHGHFGAHWTGDIDSSYEHMIWSITEIMEFNMYGLPMIGADICGFQFNTTVDLCARWSTLGAFYPFSRNHNDHDTIEQDPVMLGDIVVSAARKAVRMRYQLLPYLYTLFYEAHISGDPVIRPLFFEFLNDSTAYVIETQFMWGSALMIVPGLSNETTTEAYFPAANWYNFNTSQLITDKATTQKLEMELDEITVAQKGGSIIPTQDYAMTTAESRKTPFRIIAALDNSGSASGSLFWDDGESIGTVSLGSYNLINFKIEKDTFTSKAEIKSGPQPMPMSELRVHGIKTEPAIVSVNGVDTKFYVYANTALYVNTSSYKLDLSDDIQIKWAFQTLNS